MGEKCIQLKDIKKINLSGQSLLYLPEKIKIYTSLEYLYLDGNKISYIPDWIVNLINLKELYLQFNNINNLPTSFKNLSKLEYLGLENNEFTLLPESICNIQNLKRLHIDNNCLNDLTSKVCDLKKLEILTLDNNNLYNLPINIGNLINLKVLSINQNKLIKLPYSIGNLVNLEELYLNNNRITQLPYSIGNLVKLKKFHCESNQINNIPKSIGKLKNIEELNFSSNKLLGVPEEIGNLESLKEIDFDDNAIKHLPRTFGNLFNLEMLFINKNELQSLPSTLSKLKKLDIIEIDGNPFNSIPIQITEDGPQAIVSYISELLKKSDKRYQTKLILLGDGGAGKTCVSRALRGLPFEQQITTRGVDIVKWIFPNPEFSNDKNENVTLDIWDFEGQEIHQQTHQFFLTEDSLYLIVLKCREIFRIDRLEYWLDTIRARAPKSQTIIVITECEQRTPFFPQEKLKQKYPDLLKGNKWVFPVGCETGKGVPSLRNYLERNSLKTPLMGIEWPNSYSKIEKKIISISQRGRGNLAFITRERLNEIFIHSGIENRDTHKHIANLFGKLGIITHFPECPNLYDFIVIKPQWLTKAISLVLENEILKNDKGLISHEMIKNIWESKYPGLYSTFHNCMKEFELLYDLEYEQKSLIPLRFADVKPKIPWSENKENKERIVEYKMNIRPPIGLMSRFIVKTHHIIVKTKEMPRGVFWYNGVFLRVGHQQNVSEALCEFDMEKAVLSIKVKAAFPQNMIEQLHAIAKAVFIFYKGLSPKRSYGCIKLINNIEISCEGRHSEERILYNLKKQKLMDCDAGWHDVDPSYLVFGFTSFGKFITRKDLREELDKWPIWAKEMVHDYKSIIKRIEDLCYEINCLRIKGEQLNAEIMQKIDLHFRNYLNLMDKLLDDREFKTIPSLLSIVPLNKCKWNPSTWFRRKYVLIPYCEYLKGVHPCKDVRLSFSMSKEWWEKSASKLAFVFKTLMIGIQIASAGIPLNIDAKKYERIQFEIEFMKELASHLESIESLNVKNSKKLSQSHLSLNGIKKEKIYNDEEFNRQFRIQLAQLLENIAPKNYRSRQWGTLKRYRMNDNSYRWLCDEHARKLGKL